MLLGGSEVSGVFGKRYLVTVVFGIINFNVSLISQNCSCYYGKTHFQVLKLMFFITKVLMELASVLFAKQVGITICDSN